MASLICWASGLLEVIPTKEVPVDIGPIVLMTGPQTRLHSVMSAFGEYRQKIRAWYVPGTQRIPEDPDAAAKQQENMTLVIAFNKKIDGR